MRNPFKREKKLTPQQETNMMLEASIMKDSALPRGSDNIDDIGHEFFMAEDEKILDLFDPNSKSFVDWLEPYKPRISRMMSLTCLNDKQAEAMISDIEVEMKLLMFKRKTFYEKALVRSLMKFMISKVYDSVNGWKLIRLTDKRRTVTVQHNENKKRNLI